MITISLEDLVASPEDWAGQLIEISGYLTILSSEIAILTQKGNWQTNHESILVIGPKQGFGKALSFFFLDSEIHEGQIYNAYQIHPFLEIYQFPATVRGVLNQVGSELWQLSSIEYISAEARIRMDLQHMINSPVYRQEAWIDSMGGGQYRIRRKIRLELGQDDSMGLTLRGRLNEVLHKDNKTLQFVIHVESPPEIKESHGTVWLLPGRTCDFMYKMFITYGGRLGMAEVIGKLSHIPQVLGYPTIQKQPPNTGLDHLSLLVLEDDYLSE